MRVLISDTTADVYERYAAKQGRPVDQVIEAQLKRFEKLEPGTRSVVLSQPVCEALGVALGGLPIKDAADLVAKVDQLAAVSFHHIRLDFSPQHLAELEHRAIRQGKPVADIIKATIQRMNEEFFWRSTNEAVLVDAKPEAPSAAP